MRKIETYRASILGTAWIGYKASYRATILADNLEEALGQAYNCGDFRHVSDVRLEHASYCEACGSLCYTIVRDWEYEESEDEWLDSQGE